MLRDAKAMGFGDKFIGNLWGKTESEIYLLRKKLGIRPVYKMIDSAALNFTHAQTISIRLMNGKTNPEPLFLQENSAVLGSGPIRIGQGVEFDYSTVHAIWSIRSAGYEAIIINNNPETVSTDHTTGDKLYFELSHGGRCRECALTTKSPDGVIVSLEARPPSTLLNPLAALGAPINGSGIEAIRNAEDRDAFESIWKSCRFPAFRRRGCDQHRRRRESG